MSPEAVGPDRLPPQNLDAERSVLGSMLRDNEVIDVVTQIINAESFYLDASGVTSFSGGAGEPAA